MKVEGRLENVLRPFSFNIHPSPDEDPSMTFRADNDPKFYFRFKLIGLVAIGFALWSLYDGYFTYPNQRERALAYDKHYDEGGSKEEWDAYARQRGWPTEYPGEPKSKADIAMQYVMAVIAGSVGLLTLLLVWRSRGRWMEADETGISSSWGQRVEFDQVVSLDKRRWRSKGIAKVNYENAGKRKKLVIDDYKFKREPTDAILRLLEAKIGTEKITGGPPEPTGEQLDAANAEPVCNPSSANE
jgi:hypothetical protein